MNPYNPTWKVYVDSGARRDLREALAQIIDLLNEADRDLTHRERRAYLRVAVSRLERLSASITARPTDEEGVSDLPF